MELLGFVGSFGEDRSGVTPLHMAAEEGYGEIIKLLMDDPRININPVNDAGNIPLHLAIWAGRPDSSRGEPACGP